VADLGKHDWDRDQLFDGAIVGHGFASHMRDYDVIVEVPAAKPDGSGSYIRGQYRYRFTHCVLASTETAVASETWQRSWSDVFTSYAAWKQAGEPDGFLWGREWALGYPGASTVVGADQAAAWSEKLGRAMYEVLIETNVFTLRLTCHDLRVEQLAIGDPDTDVLTPLDDLG